MKKADMLRVLLVDDNEEFRSFLKATVYQGLSGAVVAEAEDGAEGQRLGATFKPHLAFIDINLPGDMNGLMLTEQLRAVGNPVTIVIITSHDLPEYRAAAIRLGADHFLTKSAFSPVEVQGFLDRIAATANETPRPHQSR